MLENMEDLLRALLAFSFGDKGFIVIDGNEVATQHFYALRAVNGAITLDSGTKSASGDDPIANHVIADGDVLFGNFKSVQRSESSEAGSVIYAYQRAVAQEETL